MAPKFSRELVLRCGLVAGCFALLLFFFSPSWGAFRLWSHVPEMQGMLEVRRGASVLEQVAHPGAPIADPLHAAIQWRLLFPLVGRLLNLSPALLFSLAPVGCALVLGYLVTLLRRRELPWFECALITVILGAASWLFTSTEWLGYYDSWLALALLTTAFSQRSWPMWLACAAAPWIDERFVVAAPLALLCRVIWIRYGSDGQKTNGSVRVFNWLLEAAVPAVLLGTFALIRLFVLAEKSGSGATISGYFSGHRFLDAPPLLIVLGVWEGLRLGWVFVVAAIVALWTPAPRAMSSQRVALLLGAGVVVVAIVGLATAQDYSRAMTMLLPVAVLGALLVGPKLGSSKPGLLPCVSAAALLLPAHHVMNDRVNPIYYLYHELAALRSPPRGAMPEVYELRAIHEMERGEFSAAHANLSLAIKLSENPASPSRQRGILLATQGRWADALQDFSTALDHDKENPDAWFMRAQANAAVGNIISARSDLDHALSIAPTSWSTRPDVTRFLAKLNHAP